MIDEINVIVSVSGNSGWYHNMQNWELSVYAQ